MEKAARLSEFSVPLNNSTTQLIKSSFARALPIYEMFHELLETFSKGCRSRDGKPQHMKIKEVVGLE